MNKFLCKIKLGNYLENIINFLTFGNGHLIAYKIATKLGYSDCGCEKRRVFLNKLTCKDYE